MFEGFQGASKEGGAPRIGRCGHRGVGWINDLGFGGSIHDVGRSLAGYNGLRWVVEGSYLASKT